MTIEEAITTAIEYENRVRDTYREAAERAEHEGGRRLFDMMAAEEQHHVTLLNAKLEEWRKEGHVGPEGLKTALPLGKIVGDEGPRLEESGSGDVSGAELDYLRQALKFEQETSDFYRKVVGELPPEGQSLFGRILEIEEGHLALVQAQIDQISGTGYWFDVREFNLEG